MRIKLIILTILIGLFANANASAASLDELYRDIIRSDNRGYLPLFVKNRNVPDVLVGIDDLEQIEEIPATNTKKTSEPINLSHNVDQQMLLAKARQLQWLKTIAAIKSNQVTPLELNDVTSRVKENDPKATEILAWMYTKGVGVKADFVEAFNLYKKAAQLNVANAEKNALTIYKSMNEEQRRHIRSNL
jgi:TPR repeat protein